MVTLDGVIFHQVDQSATPEAMSPFWMGPANPLIWVATAIALMAFFFIISYALRCLYRRRFNERMDHHLGRFAQRIPVMLNVNKTDRAQDGVYMIPEPSMIALPSYNEAMKQPPSNPSDTHSRACYHNKQFAMEN